MSTTRFTSCTPLYNTKLWSSESANAPPKLQTPRKVTDAFTVIAEVARAKSNFSEYGTYKTVKARFWPLLSVGSP